MGGNVGSAAVARAAPGDARARHRGGASGRRLAAGVSEDARRAATCRAQPGQEGAAAELMVYVVAGVPSSPFLRSAVRSDWPWKPLSDDFRRTASARV